MRITTTQLRHLLMASGVFSSILLSTSALSATTYHVIDLGGASGSFAQGINEIGQVVGYSGTTGFIWSSGTLTSIGTLPGNIESYAVDINDNSVIAGFSRFPVNGNAITWASGTFNNLGYPLGASNYAEADGINNAGVVVGHTSFGSTFKATVWDNGNISTLSALPGYASSTAQKINNVGQVVGWSENSGVTNERATLWSGGAPIDLGLLPGNDRSLAESINNTGQIVGWNEHVDFISNPKRAFLWQSGVLTDLGAGSALGINDIGQVVGFNTVAMLWDSGNSLTLNSLLDASSSNWSIQIAYDINNSGQIVGQAIGPNGIRAVLLNPISVSAPEPTTLLLLALGGGMGIIKRYKK